MYFEGPLPVLISMIFKKVISIVLRAFSIKSNREELMKKKKKCDLSSCVFMIVCLWPWYLKISFAGYYVRRWHFISLNILNKTHLSLEFQAHHRLLQLLWVKRGAISCWQGRNPGSYLPFSVTNCCVWELKVPSSSMTMVRVWASHLVLAGGECGNGVMVFFVMFGSS